MAPRDLFKRIVERIPRGGQQIVQLLAERVSGSESHAVVEAAIEVTCSALVIGLADVEPRRADGAVLRVRPQHLADGPYVIGKRQRDLRELMAFAVGDVGRRWPSL